MGAYQASDHKLALQMVDHGVHEYLQPNLFVVGFGFDKTSSEVAVMTGRRS